jgi:hypothetical protein
MLSWRCAAYDLLFSDAIHPVDQRATQIVRMAATRRAVARFAYYAHYAHSLLVSEMAVVLVLMNAVGE